MKDKLVTALIVVLVLAIIVAAGALVFMGIYIFRNMAAVGSDAGNSGMEISDLFDFLEQDDETSPSEALQDEQGLQDKHTELGTDAGTYQETYSEQTSGYTMDYYLYIPEDATENMPLIIYLHGVANVGSISSLESNPVIETSKFIFGADYPAIVLVPNTKVYSWTSENVSNTLFCLIEYVVEAYEIDKEHVIITGHSMGATGVYQMIERYGTFFSAAVTISAPKANVVSAESCIGVPMMSFAGDEEDCNVQMQTLADKINAMGGNVTHVAISGYSHGDMPYGAFIVELYDWMLAQ